MHEITKYFLFTKNQEQMSESVLSQPPLQGRLAGHTLIQRNLIQITNVLHACACSSTGWHSGCCVANGLQGGGRRRARCRARPAGEERQSSRNGVFKKRARRAVNSGEIVGGAAISQKTRRPAMLPMMKVHVCSSPCCHALRTWMMCGSVG